MVQENAHKRKPRKPVTDPGRAEVTWM